MPIQLITALDFAKDADALQLVDKLNPNLCALKVGSEMFTAYGPDLVRALNQRGFKVFLDLKFHDIPNTVAQSCLAAAELEVWMLNVHAGGGMKMMQAAVAALNTRTVNRPLLIAVTVLTSINADELQSLGIDAPLEAHTVKLAALASESGLDGVVCSAWEVSAIKKQCGKSFLTVTPGIRTENNPSDDQSRIMTPAQAIKNGSDYLVIGRPITRAADPGDEVTRILHFMD